MAQQRGIAVVGLEGVLIAAKRKGLIEFVEPLLDELSSAGYRLSRDLRNMLLSLAGETGGNES